MHHLRRGTDDDGVFAEGGDDHLRRLEAASEGALGQGLPHGVEPVGGGAGRRGPPPAGPGGGGGGGGGGPRPAAPALAGPPRQAPADDDPGGVEQVDEVRHRHAEPAPGLGEHVERHCVLRPGGGRDLGGPRLHAGEHGRGAGVESTPDLPGQRACPDHGFQASVQPAAALGPPGVDRGVPDLPGDAGGAPEHLPADDEPGPDPGRDLDVGEVFDVPAGAPPVLGEGADVRVVVDPDRQVGRRADPAEHRHVRPGRKDPGGELVGAVRVQRRGHGQPGSDHGAALAGGGVDGGSDEPLHEVQGPVRVFLHRVAHRVGAAEPSVRVDQPYPYVRCADVDSQEQEGLGGEPKHHGGATAPAPGDVGYHDQSVVQQALDDSGDGRRREAAGPGQGRPRDLTGFPHRAEDPHPVVVALLGGVDHAGETSFWLRRISQTKFDE